MRYSSAVLGALAFCASEVVAFPAAAFEYAARAETDKVARAEIDAAISRYEVQRRSPGFDAEAQYVSTHGEHEFNPPKNVNTYNGDQRGPCPGLNAMANHGYLPHNGVANIQQFIQGTYDVFGMGKDLGGFLAIYGSIQDGNLASWSIGGPSSAVARPLNLLGAGQGISGSHNKYEGDASPTRPDLYQYGNDYKVITPQFQDLFDLQPNAETANYDLSVLTPFRAKRFQESIDNNPYFFNAPFSGIAVQPAAYTFIYRFMGNKSAEHPEGVLNQEVLKSFFSITGESGNFQWTEGWERIPENWYKRAIGDEYTIPFFLTDLLAAALEYPQFLDIGGNTGKVDTFTGVDFQDLTGGVFNGATLLEGNNLACFVLQGAVQFLPDVLLGAAAGVGGLLDQLNGLTGGDLNNAGCPKLNKINYDQFKQFPGAK